MPQVSAIIPIYKVSPFIERCAKALMVQTLEDVEFIFVNDASPDNSIDILKEVLKEYPQRNTRILTHLANQGLPAARNTGLTVASGEYIWHCDSDDWPEPDFLERMYTTAKQSNADIAYCDFWLDYGDRRRYMKTPDYTTAEDMLEQGFLAGLMKYNVWNKLIRRSLYRGISFPEGHSMGEDMTVIALATRAKKVVRVPRPLYHYFKMNGNAFSNTFSQRHLDDISYNVCRIQPFLEQVPQQFRAFFLLNTKLPFLFSGSLFQYELWKAWFPEANKYIGLNTYLPVRTRRVQIWADRGWWPLVWLYAFAVNKVYYGLIIRNR